MPRLSEILFLPLHGGEGTRATKDPAVEADWFHKAIFVESEEMVLENLMAGNTFLRMRHYGQDGAGPWSAVLSVTIT